MLVGVIPCNFDVACDVKILGLTPYHRDPQARQLGIGEKERDQDHDNGDANGPIYCPGQPIQTSLAFTPTALNSGAQRRVTHAGVPIGHMIEPQRGSTNHIQFALGLIRYFMANLLKPPTDIFPLSLRTQFQ